MQACFLSFSCAKVGSSGWEGIKDVRYGSEGKGREGRGERNGRRMTKGEERHWTSESHVDE